MEDDDNITLLAQVVMEDHELILENHDAILEVRDMSLNNQEAIQHIHTMIAEDREMITKIHNMAIETRSITIENQHTLARMEKGLDTVVALAVRHEQWIAKAAPVIGVTYPATASP